MVQRIEEPDIFAGAGNIDRYTLESSAPAGKVRPVIDDRDHPCLRERHACDYKTPGPQEPLRPNVARSVEGEPLPCFTPRLAA